MKADDIDGDDAGTVTDVKLFKFIGLWQTLYPATSTGGRLYRTVLGVIICMLVWTVALNAGALYLVSNDFQRFMYQIMLIFVAGICAIKAYALFISADRLGAVLDLTRYAFTSCGRRDPSLLSRRRRMLSTLLRTLLTMNVVVTIVWVASPFFITERTPVVRLDGTVSEYRACILGEWVPLSDTVYNSPAGWSAVYAYEIFYMFCNITGWMLYDCYLVTVCFALNAHFRTLTAGYEELGHTPRRDDVHNCDLIRLIKDNQALLKIHDEFYLTVRTVVVCQIVCCWIAGIISIFLTTFIFFSDWSIMSVLGWKFVCAYVSLACELSIYCYVFSHIEVAKNAVNFGLYSSNWTAMDLKFKNNILIAMIINSSHKDAARLTPKIVVNVEMITVVLKTSVSLVRLLHKTAEMTEK